jgi:hypothetical protein
VTCAVPWIVRNPSTHVAQQYNGTDEGAPRSASSFGAPPADDGWSFCNHRPVSTSSPVRLVLFDVDGTLVDHDGAVAAGAQQWLMAMGWADVGTIAGLVSEWDEIAERHFPAYRARLTTFQGQRRLRLREYSAPCRDRRFYMVGRALQHLPRCLRGRVAVFP